MTNKELLTPEKLKKGIEHALNITDKEIRMDTVLRALYFLIEAEERKKDSH